MNRILDRLGRSAAHYPWRALALWAVVTAAIFTVAASFGGQTQEDGDVPSARAQKGLDQLREHLPAAGNTSAQVVVHDPGGGVVPDAALKALAERLASLDHALGVLPPRVSQDGATALLTVQHDVPVTHSDVYGDIEPIEEAVAPTEDTNLRVDLGGELPETALGEMKGTGEGGDGALLEGTVQLDDGCFVVEASAGERFLVYFTEDEVAWSDDGLGYAGATYGSGDSIAVGGGASTSRAPFRRTAVRASRRCLSGPSLNPASTPGGLPTLAHLTSASAGTSARSCR